MLDANSISSVLEVYRPEREQLLDLLGGLSDTEWNAPTECPAYSIKGLASHILGDDLSLLSRQRDGAENGLLGIALDLPGADFATLLDAFNDRWVAAAHFFSTDILIELLRLSGEWTADYYESVDPSAPGEPVGLFGPHGASSPFWQAIAREYLERWVHQSQIRRALGRGSLAERPFVDAGVSVVAATMRGEASASGGPDVTWSLGQIELGSSEDAADVLTRALTPDEVRNTVSGPAELVEVLARVAGRP